VGVIHWIHYCEEYRANQIAVENVRQLPNVEIWAPFVVVDGLVLWKITPLLWKWKGLVSQVLGMDKPMQMQHRPRMQFHAMGLF
jgi:hypothetical protein